MTLGGSTTDERTIRIGGKKGSSDDQIRSLSRHQPSHMHTQLRGKIVHKVRYKTTFFFWCTSETEREQAGFAHTHHTPEYTTYAHEQSTQVLHKSKGRR